MKICASQNCTYCGLCRQICPKNAILYELSEKNGFYYPKIDDNLCVECGICRKQCPQNSEYEGNYIRKVYAAFSIDSQVRRDSTSGGIASILSRFVIERQGVVYGAAYSGDFSQVHHIRITDPEQLYEIQGSKYVQSSLEHIYNDIKKDVSDSRDVLFVGLPCQCNAIKNYLGTHDNLFIVDLLCSGASSPLVFQKYTTYMQEKYSSKIASLIMRDKSKGWNNARINIEFENGRQYSSAFLVDPYTQGLSKQIYIRDCCTTCRFTNEYRTGDITLGDFWGIGSTQNYEHNTNQGVSVVMVNTRQGEQFFKSIKAEIQIDERTLDEVKIMNRPLISPVGHCPENQMFLNDLTQNGYDFIIKKYFRSKSFHYKAKLKKFLRIVRVKLRKVR